MTRYSGWYLLPFGALFVYLARKDSWRTRLRRAMLLSVIAGVGPALWMLHDAITAGNPIEFYNGPNSAQAIYAHQVATTAFRYPTDGSILISARYYVEDLKLIMGQRHAIAMALEEVANEIASIAVIIHDDAEDRTIASMDDLSLWTDELRRAHLAGRIAMFPIALDLRLRTIIADGLPVSAEGHGEGQSHISQTDNGDDTVHGRPLREDCRHSTEMRPLRERL